MWAKEDTIDQIYQFTHWQNLKIRIWKCSIFYFQFSDRLFIYINKIINTSIRFSLCTYFHPVKCFNNKSINAFAFVKSDNKIVVLKLSTNHKFMIVSRMIFLQFFKTKYYNRYHAITRSTYVSWNQYCFFTTIIIYYNIITVGWDVPVWS